MKCPYCIKVCTKCGRILVANEMNFYKKKTGKWGLSAYCKLCGKQYQKQWRQDNPEYFKEYQKEHKQELKEYDKQRYQDNKEKIKEQVKQYRDNNPHVGLNSRNRQRSNKPSNITLEQYNDIINYFPTCAYCGKEMNDIHNSIDCRTIEHLIPLSRPEGTNDIWNLVSCCMLCNSDKQDIDFITWYKQKDFYSDERLNKIYEWITYTTIKYKYNAN